MIRVIDPTEHWDGSHSNLEVNSIEECPPYWAVVPDDLTTENYPYGKVTVGCHEDGYLIVETWTPISTDPTPAELREEAYNTEKCISWEDKMITVTEASQKWQYYAAEGSSLADELQVLIAAAKLNIRERYPD